MTKNLLVLTAVLEAATGIALLAVPAAVVLPLLGVLLDAPGGLVIARVTGAAILSLGLVCWLARDDGRTRPGRAIITAMLVYNVVVAVLLIYAGVVPGLTAIGLWPAAGAHTMLAVWCAASLRSS
jgi:hypothetical protein